MGEQEGQPAGTGVACPTCGQTMVAFAAFCPNCGSGVPAQLWQNAGSGAGQTPAAWQWNAAPPPPAPSGASYPGMAPPDATRPASPYTGPYSAPLQPQYPSQYPPQYTPGPSGGYGAPGMASSGAYPAYTPTTPQSYPPTVSDPSRPEIPGQWYAAPVAVAPPLATGKRRFPNKVIAGISALVLVALLGTGAYAFYHFVVSAHTETAAAQYVPANTVLFGAVDLLNAQSHGHKIDLGAFTNPGAGGQPSPLQQGTGLDWNTDVKPWLGRVVAVAAFPGAASGGGGSVGFGQYNAAVLIQSSDDGKAQAALAKLVQHEQQQGRQATTSSYNGFTVYEAQNASGAFTAGKGWVAVSSNRAGLQAVIDRLNGNGDRLSDSSAFHTATQNMPSDRFGTFYVNIQQIASAVTSSSGGTDIPFLDTYPVAGGYIGWTNAGARFQITLPASKNTGVANLTGDTSSLANLVPANALAYVGSGNLGALLQQVEKSAAGSSGGADLAQQAFGISASTPALQQPAAFAEITSSSEGNQSVLLLHAPDASAAAQMLNQIVTSQGWTTQTATVAGQQAVDVYADNPASFLGSSGNYTTNDAGQYLVASVAQVNGAFVAASSEDALSTVIQTAQGGASLGKSADFQALAQNTPTGAAAVEYLNLASLVSSLHVSTQAIGMTPTGLLLTEVWNSQEIQLTADVKING